MNRCLFSVCMPFQHFYMLTPKLLHLKYLPQETKDYTHKLLLNSPLTAVWKLKLLLVTKNDAQVKEKAGTLPQLVSLTSFCEGLHITFKIILQVPVSGHQLLPFIGWTWVTRAVKDEGTTESCSTATLMKITSAFYKLLFHRDRLVRKSMPSIACQGYISTRKHS
jgi:hypothetical protein